MPQRVLQLHGAMTPSPESSEPACPLLEQMPGEPVFYRWHGETVHYRRAGNGAPLLLVHAPDVGASCLEWRRCMESLAGIGTVYAVDLPGFGLSPARAMAYSADLYIRFLTDFLRDVVGAPARVVGSGLGASYLVHVAVRRPEAIERLLLVAPAGLSAFRPSLLGGAAFHLLGVPGVSSAFRSATTSRFSIQERLQQEVYANDTQVPGAVVEARYWGSHRPHADYVERSRAAGLLNTNIRGAAALVQQPVLLAWGRRAARPPVSDVETFCELNPRARCVIFERSALVPHEEEPSRFSAFAKEFLEPETLRMAA